MLPEKKEHPQIKSELHPRNKHRERYDFKLLIQSTPELSAFVSLNKYKDESIDFFNPKAVKALNKALLKCYYNITDWDIPVNYLCPPVPGRADYIHYMADLLASKFGGVIPKGSCIKCLDIGVGANCIYPIIGLSEYGWEFVGTDIDPVSIRSANRIIDSNPFLKGKIKLQLQHNLRDTFVGVIQKNEHFDLSICNPPFHSSLADAQAGTLRKLSNLKGKKVTKSELNFGGQNNELWCKGGEEKFVSDMIFQSKKMPSSCFWYSTLISKQSMLNKVYNQLNRLEAVEIKTIHMGQGNKISRIVAWTFLKSEQQKKWMNERWK